VLALYHHLSSLSLFFSFDLVELQELSLGGTVNNCLCILFGHYNQNAVVDSFVSVYLSHDM